jgi:hypothetical protein
MIGNVHGILGYDGKYCHLYFNFEGTIHEK